MLIDVGGAQSERHKWVHAFKNVSAIIFVAASDDYDEVCPEDPTLTKMQASIELFTEVFHSNWTGNVPILLFLSKIDSLPEKLKRNSLAVSFPGYIPYAEKHLEKLAHNAEMMNQIRALVKDVEVEQRRKKPGSTQHQGKAVTTRALYASDTNNRGELSLTEPVKATHADAIATRSAQDDSYCALQRLESGKQATDSHGQAHHSSGERSASEYDNSTHRDRSQSGSSRSLNTWEANVEVDADWPDHRGRSHVDDPSSMPQDAGDDAASETMSVASSGMSDSRDDASSIYQLFTSVQDETASAISGRTFIIRPQVFQKLLTDESIPEEHRRLLQQRFQQQATGQGSAIFDLKQANARKVETTEQDDSSEGNLSPVYEDETKDTQHDHATTSPLGSSADGGTDSGARTKLPQPGQDALQPSGASVFRATDSTKPHERQLPASGPFNLFESRDVDFQPNRTKTSEAQGSSDRAPSQIGVLPESMTLNSDAQNLSTESALDVKAQKRLLVKEVYAALSYIRERFWGKIKEESSALSSARKQSCCASLLDTEQVTVVATSLERLLSN